MVTQTFLNLKEDKQERVIRAGLAEFSRVPMERASVTNIVKNAGISRGSFYQYFDGKEEMYKYIVSVIYAKHRRDLYESLKLHQRNLYQGLIDFYNAYIDEITNSEYFYFYENTFLHTNQYLIGREGLLRLSNLSEKRRIEQEDFLSQIDTDNLKIDSEKDLLEFIYFTVNLIHQMVVDGFLIGLPAEEIKEKSIRAIDWLYYGIKDEN